MSYFNHSCTNTGSREFGKKGEAADEDSEDDDEDDDDEDFDFGADDDLGRQFQGESTGADFVGRKHLLNFFI